MKKFSLLVLSLLICSGTFCQETIDIEMEKEAIIAVINAETQAYYDRDFEAYAATWKHDESDLDIRAGKASFGITFGWEGPSSGMKEFFKNNPEPAENVEVKKNFKIKVYKDCAWATFNQETHNSEGEIVTSAFGTNFLEKTNGEWKIVYLTRLSISSYYDDFKEIQLSKEEITKYLGKYELQPGFILSVFYEDDHLYTQATGQDKFEIFASGDNKFFTKDFSAQIEFNMENEEVVGATIIQNGENEAKKIE